MCIFLSFFSFFLLGFLSLLSFSPSCHWKTSKLTPKKSFSCFGPVSIYWPDFAGTRPVWPVFFSVRNIGIFCTGLLAGKVRNWLSWFRCCVLFCVLHGRGIFILCGERFELYSEINYCWFTKKKKLIIVGQDPVSFDLYICTLKIRGSKIPFMEKDFPPNVFPF